MKDPKANRPSLYKTKLGWIPQDWQCVPLSEAFTQRKNKGEPGLPVLSVTMDQGMVLRSSLDRKIESEVSPEESLLVEPGDIAYNMMRMWQGAVTVADMRGVVSPAYVVCRPRKGVDPRFMLYQFKSHLGLYRLWANSYGITGDRLRLYFPDFALVSMLLPPLAKQKMITQILSTWDVAIEKTNGLIAAKKEQKKALMQKLLTGKRRLPGFGDEWRICRLGDLFDERCEVGADHLPLLAITGTCGIILASEIERKDSSSENKSRYKVIRSGDIGYNTMRMWQGVSAVSSLEGIVSPAYTICIPKSSVDAMFMGYFFKYQPMVHLFWRHSQGMVDDTLSLKYHNFARISVLVPDKSEQCAIADVLSTADCEIASLEAKLTALKEQKKGLMQKLLTGEIQVS